jgi:hypothetical protein
VSGAQSDEHGSGDDLCDEMKHREIASDPSNEERDRYREIRMARAHDAEQRGWQRESASDEQN